MRRILASEPTIDNTGKEFSEWEISTRVFWASIIASVLTIFDGAFTYWIIGQGLGREANPVLNAFVAYYESQGMSHMDAFGLVMIWRVVIGVAMVFLLALSSAWPRKKPASWMTRNGSLVAAGILIALTVYHIIGYFTVFQYR